MSAAIHNPPSVLRGHVSLTGVLEAFLDPTIVVAMLFAAAYGHDERLGPAYVVLAMLAFSLTFPGKAHLRDPLQRVLRRFVVGWLLLAAALWAFGYLSGYLYYFPQPMLITWIGGTPLAIALAHLALRATLPRVIGAAENRRTAVIAGANEIGMQLARQFADNPYLGTRVAGFFDDRERARAAAGNHPVLGNMTELAGYVKQHRIDTIYLALPMATQPRILGLLDDLKDTTASIYFVPDIFVTDLIQGRVDTVCGMPVVAVCETPFTGLDGALKRVSDVVLAAIILVLLSPLLLAVAAGVKLSSPGPAIFRQRRYGLDGREIVVYKFRSMTTCDDGAVVKQASRNDQRITRFGAFIRRTSLDELPQFFNVLQGRMSIVGPRPHAVAHNETYRKLIKGYMIRHKVKPGITGWAQVNGYRGETETVDKMQKRIDFDLEYLRNWSLKLDLWIIVKTALLVVRDRNAF
ncbi:putative glycosyltransferase [Azoarcus olearius]|uniref:undecaprenyl-phosphate glucose phosphotransferase n=1 Tax=Azoarcus sp. (strain BH72) TaxID=418699 RepID=UPI00080640B0|nr:undecaprenyl-phosphate glucose phosphotransferase [Azoarcus olearius]ANQ85410.1 putative glycosyltransferase [Azoarcus olearius]